MNKPLLFLDVDGVLNVSGACLHARQVNDLEDHGARFQIHIPDGLEDRVKTLIDNFEMVWGTTWEDKAHPFWKERLDLPTEAWPHIRKKHGLKIYEIIKFAGDRPWAWLDDEAKVELRMAEVEIPNDCIVVCPTWKEGLNDKHVQELLDWKNGLN